MTRAAPSSVATLSSLTLSSGTLSPTFTSGTASYTTTSSASSITITPAVTQANATVKVNGTATTSGSASAALPMSNGSNTVTVLVTAQDGTTQSTYTITVYQPTLTGGAQWDNTNSYYRLGTSGSNLELSADWTPAWSNIVGYWKLNESAGATVSDSSSAVSPTTGTLTGTGITLNNSGKLGTSAAFTGSGFISFGTSTGTATPSFSFGLWFKTYFSGYLISKRYYCSGADTFWQLGATGSTLELQMVDGSFDLFSNRNNLSDGNWHHVVVTRSGGVATIYLDGVYDNSASGAGTGTLTNILADLEIGAACGWAGKYNGSIDDVAIWNTALSASAVSTIYQHQSAKYSGTITSAIQNALSGVTWSSLSWLPTLPFFKALPDAGVSETAANYVGFASPTPTPTPLMSGIVGLWHLDETATGSAPGGKDFKDNSGNTYHGTITGGVTPGRPGKVGNAASFDGSTGRIGLTGGTTSNMGISNHDFTAEAWVYSNPGSLSSDQGILGEMYALGAVGSQLLHLLIRGHKALFGFYFDDTGGTITLSEGVWNHLVFRFTQSTGEQAIFVNGKLDIATSGHSYTGSGGIYIGFANASFFSRMIAEVAIWNRPLSAAEVLQLYRRGANRMMFQVRSCADASCTTGSPSWLGPDGTSWSAPLKLEGFLSS